MLNIKEHVLEREHPMLYHWGTDGNTEWLLILQELGWVAGDSTLSVGTQTLQAAMISGCKFLLLKLFAKKEVAVCFVRNKVKFNHKSQVVHINWRRILSSLLDMISKMEETEVHLLFKDKVVSIFQYKIGQHMIWRSMSFITNDTAPNVQKSAWRTPCYWSCPSLKTIRQWFISWKLPSHVVSSTWINCPSYKSFEFTRWTVYPRGTNSMTR